MADWIASRGTTASGPLTAPPAGPDCRGWEEDQVLARLMGSPHEAPQLIAALTADTFTTDIRYDVYQSIVALADRGGYYAPEQLEAELHRRMATVPTYALANYGGATGLFARAYLSRLASTEISSVAAATTASILVQEDAHYRKRLAAAAPRAQAPETAAGREHRPGQTAMVAAPLQEPRPHPAPDAITVQRP
jgi:replicative DNA helicase